MFKIVCKNLIQMNKMPMVVIYDNPSDHQDFFVARLFVNGEPTQYYEKEKKYETILEHIPEYMACIDRADGDEPHIKEVWL